MDLEKEESIDLGKLWQVAKTHRKVVGGIIVSCTAAALVAGLVWPKTYESTTTVQTRMTGSQLASSGVAMAAAAFGLGNTSASTMTYVELMKSNTVLQPIIDELDWPEDDKEFLTPEKFAKTNLNIENTKQTNLIKVTAKGKTPEEAQMISQHVVDNFLSMMTDMNKETQSLLVKFLNERIDEAKKDAEEASEAFADFQKQRKVYSPEEQAKALVSRLEAYDEAIVKMETQQQTGQAALDVANANLSEMKAGSQAFNINDNPNVESIRGKIVAKQVELVGMEQKYTDRHPSVVAAKEQLAALQDKLREEVAAVVSSNATSMNPAQAKLVENKAQAEASIATAKASEKAIKQHREERAQEIADFPEDVIQYMNLQREVKIKNEIYDNLVKQCEQNKIQQAMDSMDIQVVDPANLPFVEKPVWPRPKLMTALGFVLGVVASFVYSLVLYKRGA